MGQVLGLAAVFNPWLLLVVFGMTLIAEFGLSVPLLLESVWLFTGYSFTSGSISIEQLVMFMAVGLVGRLLGGTIVFYLAWYGQRFIGVPLFRFLKTRGGALISRYKPLQRVASVIQNTIHGAFSRAGGGGCADDGGIRILGRRFRISPLTVACGRLVGLRWPITLFLGVKRQRTKLLLGIAIFSVVWDAAYLLFGMVGGKSGLSQMQMVFIPIGIVVTVSALIFGFKRVRSFLKSRKSVRPAVSPALCCPLPNIRSRHLLALRTTDSTLFPDNS